MIDEMRFGLNLTRRPTQVDFYHGGGKKVIFLTILGNMWDHKGVKDAKILKFWHHHRFSRVLKLFCTKFHGLKASSGPDIEAFV